MPNGEGLATTPANDHQWQTLATGLEEFQKISDNLSSSEAFGEAAVSEVIKTQIIPILEELRKKKERALKRKQKRALQSNGYLNSNRVGFARSCRERRPVCYTFDEYDRSIDEAIEISKKLKTTGSKQKDDVKHIKQIPQKKDALKVDQVNSDIDEIETQNLDNNTGDDEKENNKYQSDNVGYNNYAEEEEDDFVSDARTKVAVGLYRSQRLRETTKGLPEMRKRLRQRLTRNSTAQIVPDSEGSSKEYE